MPFQIIRDDITKVKADAIVNTANPKPVFGRGTDYAIYKSAGEEGTKQLLEMRREIGMIEPGQVRETPAPGLSAKYILHTVGPAWQGGENGEFEILQACYENCLALGAKLGCESVAFPLISTGYYGFPKDKALEIAISVISRFLLTSDMNIILVVFDRRSFELSGKIFSEIDEFIDEHYAQTAMQREYGREFEANSVLPPMVSGSRDEQEAKASNASHKGKNARSGKRKGIPGLLLEKLKEKGKHNLQEDDFLEESLSAFSDSASESSVYHMPAMSGTAPGSAKPDIFEEKDAASSRPPKTLEEAIAHVGDTWQQSLLRLIDEKQLTDVEVYKRANVDRKLFSKIRGKEDYQPKKITAVAFALALHLNLDDTKDFIGRAGFALSPSNLFDLIVAFFIEQEVYDTYTINMALFAHDQPLIGG